MKINIYGHGGSQNHGNEAIVRGVNEIFKNEKVRVFSSYPNVDIKWDLNRTGVKISNFIIHENNKIRYRLAEYIKQNDTKLRYYRIFFDPFIGRIRKGDVYLLEAGDQYNEPGEHRSFYAYLNKRIQDKGGYSIMMGCTVDPEVVCEETVLNDLNTYSLVVARESITYNAMINNGVRNILLLPDPAFAMPSEQCKIPAFFGEEEVIGINVGFLAQAYEEYYEILMKNCMNAIEYILENTNYTIALIPHVNWGEGAQDMDDLLKLYDSFKESGRIHIVDEHNAPKIKYIIGKCKIMIALRTHATIAALGEMVPTIALGYKTKTRGIYKDIFGENSAMLADIQSLKNDFVLTEKLRYVIEHVEELQKDIMDRVPSYIEKVSEYNKILDRML